MYIITIEQKELPVLLKTSEKFLNVIRADSGEISIVDMTCRHRGGPLTHGVIENGEITCPWHGFKTKQCKLKKATIAFIADNKNITLFINEFERIVRTVD